MNAIIDARFEMTYHTAITTSAPKKRNPETPVKNEGNISAWRVATQRKMKPEAMSVTKMKHPLTIMAPSKSSDHNFIAKPPRRVSRQHNAKLCMTNLRLSLLISITLRNKSSFVDLHAETHHILLHLYKAATNIKRFLLATR